MTRLRMLPIGVAVCIFAFAAVTVGGAARATEQDSDAIASMYVDKQPFLEAIAREEPSTKEVHPVTGITVPHHLLAADLIARGFWAAAGNTYDRVIILSPDHFNKSGHPFATTSRDIETVLGTARNDQVATATLLEQSETFEESDLFKSEHGVAAILPFVRWFFPNAKIVPIVVSVAATRTDWDLGFAAINALLDPRTLVVQSTDFSHYLLPEIAMQRDQETLNVIASGNIEAVAGLIQPDHLDSKGSQYIQMKIQSALGSEAVVIANRNSIEYSPAQRTTSYVVTIYSGEPVRNYSYPDQEVVYFGGDGFFGRWLTQALADQAIAAELVGKVIALTGGRPLILNLEGVLLDEIPEGLALDLHPMVSSLTVPILRKLNVEAASLANNHGFDLGRGGLRESASILLHAGIRPLLHGASEDFGAFRLVTLNFVGSGEREGYPVVRKGDLKRLCNMRARPPFIAFVHWGQEYTTAAGPAEYAEAEALHDCGVGAIIGAHSHQASANIEAIAGGMYWLAYSLGNLFFDQHGARGSGALLELRFFKQGTYAARLIALPNLFDLGSELIRRGQDFNSGYPN